MKLQRAHKNKTKKTVGRGGVRGKTSGRGHKGQKQHGGTPRPAIRDILKKLPKRRGYRFNSIKNKPFVINVAQLDSAFSSGDTVNPGTLVEKGLLKGKGKSVADVKILGNGDLSQKLTVTQCLVSESARQKITAAGGSVEE
jgi:large subunit ribosomal protein L15